MISRSIDANDILAAVGDGLVIKEYPDDKPYPSFLILKFVNQKPYHVVVANNKEDSNLYCYYLLSARCKIVGWVIRK